MVLRPLSKITTCHQSKKFKKQKLVPAVTHIDGTGRVQCVKNNINIKYYDLIKKFYEKTNVPIIF